MAKISFEEFLAEQDNTQNFTNTSRGINFFSLKDDGDEAIVRFIYDDVSQFDIRTVHSIPLNGKYRDVNCIRDSHEPLSRCPMCNDGAPLRRRFYIYFLQYVKQPDGSYVAQGCVWSRAAREYGIKLKGYMDNYGPLSDMICKIIRHGKAGDIQTTYEIIPNLNKNIYPDTVFVKDFSCFDNVNNNGFVVMNKNAEELRYYQETGQFPAREREEAPAAPAFEVPTTSYDPINDDLPWNTPGQMKAPSFVRNPMGDGVIR